MVYAFCKDLELMAYILFDALCQIDGKLVLGWFQLIFMILGFCIARQTYAKTQMQRRLENSFRLIDHLHKVGSITDLHWFVENFVNSSNALSLPTDHTLQYKMPNTPTGFLKTGWEIVKPNDLFSGKWTDWDHDLVVNYCRQFNFVCDKVERQAAERELILSEFKKTITDLKLLISKASADDTSLGQRFSSLTKFTLT